MVMWTLDTFYKSREWENFRAILIDQRTDPDTGLVYCAHCGKPIVKAYDIIGHHLTELTEENVNDRAVSLHPDNVVLVHHRCHNIIHRRFGYSRGTARKVYLVYGPPLAGKSTWVQSVAGEKDLILDLDKIWQAVTNNPEYIKPEEIKTCVFAVRDTLLDCIKSRRGKWTRAYVIGGYPIAREREELAAKLGAELVPVIEPEAECLARLDRASDGRDKAAWTRYIRDWYDRAG